MDKKTLLYDRRQIAARVAELANTLNQHYEHKELIVIGVLKGAAIFLADLVRLLDVPLVFECVALSSYGASKASSRQIQLTTGLQISVEGADVLVVDDIIDTGRSAAFLCQYLATKQPASLKTCFLIDKSERREVEFTPDYVGFVLDRGFVVGYGMDYAEKYRNLPEVYRLD